MPKNKLIGLFLMIFFSALLLVPLVIESPLAAAASAGFILIAASALLFGIKGALPAIFYSSAIVFFSFFKANDDLNLTIILIIMANYFASGLSIAIIKEFMNKKNSISTENSKNHDNPLLSLSVKQDLFEIILENAQSYIYVKDINLKFIKVSTSFENLTGKNKTEIIGKTDFDIFPKNIAEKMAQDDIDFISKSCLKQNVEENISLTDGRNIWLNSNKIPLLDSEGKTCGIIGISYEITEIKKMIAQMETLLDSLPYKIWLKDTQGRFLAVNKLLAEALLKKKEEMVGKNDMDFYPEEYAKKFMKDDLDVIRSKKPILTEETGYFNNIQRLHETYKAPIINKAGEVIGTVGYSRDISDIQKSLFESKKQINFFNSIIDNIPIMLFLKDAKDLRFKMVNKAAENILGISREEILGKNDYDMFPASQADFFIKKDREALENKSSLFIEEEKITHKDMTKIISTKKLPLLNENCEPEYLLGISEDITEKLKMEKTIKKLAFYDEITGLPNRNLFKERFLFVCEQAKRNNKKIMVLMLDFDKFKLINDQYGHDTGDSLLKNFANRVKKIMRKTDTFARFGGDEFVMVLPDFNNTSDMENFATKILGLFKEPFRIGKLRLQINGSMGISVFPDDSVNYSDLVKFADSAMYAAKAGGGSNFKFYKGLKVI